MDQPLQKFSRSCQSQSSVQRLLRTKLTEVEMVSAASLGKTSLSQPTLLNYWIWSDVEAVCWQPFSHGGLSAVGLGFCFWRYRLQLFVFNFMTIQLGNGFALVWAFYSIDHYFKTFLCVCDCVHCVPLCVCLGLSACIGFIYVHFSCLFFSGWSCHLLYWKDLYTISKQHTWR